MMRAFAVVVPAWKVPTTVEEACDTKPAPKVARPDVVSVLRESDPALRVPMVATFALKLVVLAPELMRRAPLKVDVAVEPKVSAPLIPLMESDATVDVARTVEVAKYKVPPLLRKVQVLEALPLLSTSAN